jgi:hypothetical protein
MHRVQTCKVQIASIRDVDGPCFYWQDIENVDVCHLAVADMKDGGNGAPKIQQRVQLDSRLGGAPGNCALKDFMLIFSSSQLVSQAQR